MRLADVAARAYLFCRRMLRVAGAEVSVRQSADPSACKVGEAALAGARRGKSILVLYRSSR